MNPEKKIVIVISDCHLSAGRFIEGRLNAHEDFFMDEEMCQFFEYFSSANYGEGRSVELFINGDYLDYLNVPYHGEFEETVTEEIALYKTEMILAGHPKVMASLKRFASLPGKKITYLIGNHDAELFFEKVRERITREWDPKGEYPSEKVKLIANQDRVRFQGGIEIHHGNQHEAVHVLDFEKPFLTEGLPQPVLNIPWGSFYVLKIINRLKWEREFIDKVRPIKVFVLFGLLLDFRFTLKFIFLSTYYFLKTRLKSNLRITAKILQQEADFLLDLEKEARAQLDQNPELKTVIFGHTHKPMNKVYPDGKQYINTGTWTKMINLDWRTMGQRFCLTFAYIEIENETSFCELRTWEGEQSPHRPFRG